MLLVRQDDLSGDQTRSLLALHLAGMHDNSPAGSVFALDLAALMHPTVTVWSAWFGDEIASVGALRMHSLRCAEVKSMRTHPNFLRRGAATAILERIIETGVAKGAKCISLETGSGPAFEPALALYRRRGFRNGAPFADYEASGFNQFLHLIV